MDLISMLFPGGRSKAVTASFDDGVNADAKTLEIFRQHGMKATFNINSGFIGEGNRDQTETARPCFEDEAVKIYTDDSAEVATHGRFHKHYRCLPPSGIMEDMLRDRTELEKMFGRLVRGHAYPYGDATDEAVKIARMCGLVYGRTVNSTHRFGIPEDFLRWDPTCHQAEDEIFSLAESFVNEEPDRLPALFYFWAHSYEFYNNGSWDRLEKICAVLGDRDDIWYATNMEVYDYVSAFRSLVFSADTDRVYNPTLYDIWLRVNDGGRKIVAPSGKLTFLPFVNS